MKRDVTGMRCQQIFAAKQSTESSTVAVKIVLAATIKEHFLCDNILVCNVHVQSILAEPHRKNMIVKLIHHEHAPPPTQESKLVPDGFSYDFTHL